jgi:hypothetical protein
MSDLQNLDWSQDPVGKDTRSDKQKRNDYMENQVEYRNPHLKKRLNANFPPHTPEELERLKNCDMYGNPRKADI